MIFLPEITQALGGGVDFVLSGMGGARFKTPADGLDTEVHNLVGSPDQTGADCLANHSFLFGP